MKDTRDTYIMARNVEKIIGERVVNLKTEVAKVLGKGLLITQDATKEAMPQSG